MPKVRLTPQMREFAEREIAAGLYLDMSDVVRAAMRPLMEERGAAAFCRLRADLMEQVRLTLAGETVPFEPRL